MSLRYSLRELEVFVAIARQGSVSRAAEAVALTQSAASQALAKLERALGQPLFDRCGRRLVLNENGRLLWPRAQALLDAAAQVQDLLADGGLSMRLGASTTIANYLLPPRLAAFRTAYPAACVQLTVGNTGEVVAAVAAMELDFGLIEGACHHPDLAVSDWQQDELVIIAPPGHALTRGRATRAALAGAAWLLREPGSGTREEVERWLHTHVGPVRMDMELGNSEAIRRAVAAGLGVSCLSRNVVAEALAAGSVAEVRTGLPSLSRPLRLVRHRERAPTRGMQAFLALAPAGEQVAAV
ncbi:MAG: LysR family transcriptional regulator [Burkholderiaceae bacterium]